jgi:hypothetical protein
MKFLPDLLGLGAASAPLLELTPENFYSAAAGTFIDS